MSSERETKIKEIFARAADLAASERSALLERACGPDPSLRREIERLLKAHDSAEGFLESASTAAVVTPAAIVQEKPGDVIGHFKLLQKIGEGGFGVVYMAEQTAPVRRRVALKIVKLGMDTKQVIARFEAERQALALMDHPNIAHVFDAGATDTGRPYFVMELVKGIPITAYCDEARLSNAERLQLFTVVCQAIQHAHQKGIIHRDIKPTNVLVTLHDGVPVPKVIDFGVAKATEARLTERTLFTEFRQIVGTPEYMSPEQAEMSGLDVDTRADIYSLGVVLYELLTGTKPLDLETLLAKGYGEMLRAIREVEPPRPSTRVSSMGGKARAVAHKRSTASGLLPKALEGDLDWIVMRALEKDRTRRYATAVAFAADIERHLEDRPVEARPPSTLYLLRKFVRRNRTGVIAGGVAALAIAAGLVLAVLGYVEADRQRDAALLAETQALEERNEAQRAGEQEREAREREAEARAEAAEEAERALAERDAKEEARSELAEALTRSEGSRLLATSNAWLPRDPTLALLLAIEGAKRNPGLLANAALLDALDDSPSSERHYDTDASPTPLSFALDAQSRRFAVADLEHQVLVFDVATGRRLHVLKGHGDLVSSVAFSPNGRRVLTASRDWTAGLWDAETGRLLHALRSHEAGVTACFDPRGVRVLTTSDDGKASLWDAASGALLHTFEGVGERAAKGSFSRDGSRALVWSSLGVRIYDAKSGATSMEFLPPAENNAPPIAGVAWSPDDRWLAVSLQSRELHLLDAETGTDAAHVSIPGTRGVTDVLWARQGHHLLVADGGRVHRWLVQGSGDDLALEPLPSPDDGYFPYEVSWGDQKAGVLAAPSRDGSIVAFALPSLKELWRLRGRQGGIRFCRLHTDGHRVLTVDADGNTHLYDPRRLGARRCLEGEDPAIMAMDVSPDGRFIAAGSGGGQTAGIWRVDTGERVHQLRGHWMKMELANMMNWVTGVTFGRRGRRLVTCGTDGTARVWDVTTGGERLCLEPKGSFVWHSAFSPDGRLLAIGCRDEVARIYDAESGELLHALGEPQPEEYHVQIPGRLVTFNASGDLLAAVAVGQDLVRVYDVATGRLQATFEGSAASFSPDGRMLAVTRWPDRDPRNAKTTTLFDVAAKRAVQRFPGAAGGWAATSRPTDRPSSPCSRTGPCSGTWRVPRSAARSPSAGGRWASDARP